MHLARCLILSVLIVPTPVVTAQNLLTNPDFGSDISSWTEANGNVEAVYRADVGSTLDGGSGPGAIEVRFSFWNGGGSGVYQEVSGAGATSYTTAVTAFVPSADNPARQVTLFINSYAGNGSLLDTQTFYPDQFLHDTWMRIEATFLTPPGTSIIRFFPVISNAADPAETRPGIAYFDDCLLAVTGTGTTVQQLFYPAAASVAGSSGTFWTTDGWITNLTGGDVELLGAFLPQQSDNSAVVASPAHLATLSSGATVVLEDLVASLGGSDHAGGVYLQAEAAGIGVPLPLVAATSYTSTPSPSTGGGYGQGIPAETAGFRVAAVAPGVFQNAARRTNIGALNTSDGSIDLDIRILDPQGQVVATTTWSLPAYSQRQVSLTSLGVASLTGGSVEFTRTSGSGSYSAYLSTVDAVTGDAVYVAAH